MSGWEAGRGLGWWGLKGAQGGEGGTSSQATQSMAPAANPNPIGWMTVNASTHEYASTAMSGCGILVKMDQRAAPHTDMPLLTSTELTAKPVVGEWGKGVTRTRQLADASVCVCAMWRGDSSVSGATSGRPYTRSAHAAVSHLRAHCGRRGWW